MAHSLAEIEGGALRLPPEDRGRLAVDLLASLEESVESPQEIVGGPAAHAHPTHLLEPLPHDHAIGHRMRRVEHDIGLAAGETDDSGSTLGIEPLMVPTPMARGGARPRWCGGFSLGAGKAVYVGPVFDTTPHSHHALQLCVALEGILALRSGDAGEVRHYTAALVAADHTHQIVGEAPRVGLVYVEPESDAGQRLLTRLDGRGILDLGERAATLQASFMSPSHPPGDDSLGQRAEAAVATLVDTGPVVPRLDRRVAEAVRVLHQARGEYPASDVLARRLGCSAGRFRHLFRQQVGIGYRSYLLWLRLGVAAEELLGSASLTTAAHAAGFADSAHLTRTFRRMFGLAPSQAPPFVS